MKYDRKNVYCLKRDCMNNKQGKCELLHLPIIGKRCPFYKTKMDNDKECMELGVQTWQEMIES